MLRKLIFVAMLAGVSSARVVHAQQPVHIVRGQVLDANTGESLPSANIRIEGTWRGTITNADGVFEIAIRETPAELVFRYIGYESQRYPITDRSMQRIEIRMQPTTYRMPELVVTDENPAIGIMRCVIDRKQERRALLSSYASEAYTRFTVSNDTSIVAIIETLSEVFWDKEQGMRELIKSRRQTSNLGIELTDYLPAALFIANLYDDDVPLAGYNFMGVTHPNALDIYRFSLQGARLIDERLVYDITVAPKSRLNTGFVGEIAVLSDECALLEVALEPGEAFLFPPPVTGIDATLYQQYDSFDGSAWLPVDFRSDLGIDISFGPLLTFPTFKVRQVSRITDYRMEAVLPDSLYAEGKYLGVDQEAVAADTLLDREGIAVPFEEPERVAYAGIDSTMTFEKAFEPTGLLMRLPGQTDAQENEEDKTEEPGFISGFITGTEWVQPRFRFNRVEGFHGGLSMKHESERLYVKGGGGWSREPEDPWSYDISGEIRLGPERHGFIGASYFYGIEPRIRSHRYGAMYASMYSLFGGGDYFDYLHNRRVGISGGYDRNRLRVTLAVQREIPESVDAVTAYDLLAKSGKPRPNPPVSNKELRSASVTVRYGDPADLMTMLLGGGRYAELEIETGDDENVYEDYLRVATNIQWTFPTFFSRRLLPNVLSVHWTAGAHLGNLPVQRFGIIDGAFGNGMVFGTLRTLVGRPYEGDRYAGFFWEHNFQTTPFEMLGLQGLAQRGYGIIVGGAHARTWISSSPRVERPNLHLSSQGMHHEITVALNGIFGILQIGYSRRLDKPDYNIGISVKQFF